MFLFILRREPSSSLFPYTTLFRSAPIAYLTRWRMNIAHTRLREENTTRSEEHTSELQSRGHLVCRLLLEKKKWPRVGNHLLHRPDRGLPEPRNAHPARPAH